MQVPEGFGPVTPYIFADGAEGYVRFLEAAFGAHETGRSTAPNGCIANRQLQFSTTTIMVSEAPEQFPAPRAAKYLYVADAAAAMTKVEQAGAQKIMDVGDVPYGDRQGGVRDPAGNIWRVSQRMTMEPHF
jgi:PhnB protein